ncbi:LOB domain-containing protein 20-like [Diospyros lotus]|uniref:LOB domain-containing protein 20-like n=1 Tax=Diospyros lotus TaxID=55363 RepID=UPI0022536B01|nr:LOB domain-containing protein 20-like [Diospyros lotus]
MADPPGDVVSYSRRKGADKQATPAADDANQAVLPPTSPCGACKFLRRKCVSECIFAPYFSFDQGAAQFAAVHKVFGASNVSKLLLHIPISCRQEAIATISYEAQARLSDPVYGCVSSIIALQQQVAFLQGEIAMVHNQLNNRLAMANAMQSSQQQQQMAMLQSAFSNNVSSTTNNLVNMSNFNSSCDLTAEMAPSAHRFEPHQYWTPCQDDEEEDEEDTQNLVGFANHILNPK